MSTPCFDNPFQFIIHEPYYSQTVHRAAANNVHWNRNDTQRGDRYYRSIWLEGLRKITKSSSQNRGSLELRIEPGISRLPLDSRFQSSF
jgi:hypothetical protein